MWWNSSWAISDPERWCCESAALNMPANAVATGLKRSVFIPIPKKGNAKECSNYCTIALILHASKVILKILQTRLQQYVNHELPDVQSGFRKGRGTRDQIANICWIIKRAREFQKNIYFCFIDYAKASDFVDHNKLWKILKEMGIPDYLTCLLRNLYAGQEVTVRNGHGATYWFQIGKRVRQGCILSPCLFNVHAEYIMWSAGLDRIKIARRNINNLRYATSSLLLFIVLCALQDAQQQECSSPTINRYPFLQVVKVKNAFRHYQIWYVLRGGTWRASWETCMQVRKQQLKPDMKQRSGSKLGTEYIKAVYCHLTYLTYMQNASCELPRKTKHKL